MGCLVTGCPTTLKLIRGMCAKHYQQSLRGLTVDDMEETQAASIPPAPKAPPDKKRCHARMKDGTRCIRAVKAKGFCAAHWRECCDQQEMALRTDLDIPVREPFQYEGDEAMLAQIYGRNR